jgi:hypothetical protein
MQRAMKLEDRRMKRARLVRDGMSWRQACLPSGYSLSVANKGPRGYSGADGLSKPGVLKDFERAAEEAAYPPEFIRKAVNHRLMKSVIEGNLPMWRGKQSCLESCARWTYLSGTLTFRWEFLERCQLRKRARH